VTAHLRAIQRHLPYVMSVTSHLRQLSAQLYSQPGKTLCNLPITKTARWVDVACWLHVSVHIHSSKL